MRAGDVSGLLVACGDYRANAAEVEALMRRRVEEGKAPGRGFARLHQRLLMVADELEAGAAEALQSTPACIWPCA